MPYKFSNQQAFTKVSKDIIKQKKVAQSFLIVNNQNCLHSTNMSKIEAKSFLESSYSFNLIEN